MFFKLFLASFMFTLNLIKLGFKIRNFFLLLIHHIVELFLHPLSFLGCLVVVIRIVNITNLLLVMFTLLSWHNHR